MRSDRRISNLQQYDLAAEQDLILLAQGGDREAFGELVRRHRGQLYGFAQRLTRNPHLAEEVVQDTLTDAYVHIDSLRQASHLGPWLRTIARNRANMRLRRGGVYRREHPSSHTLHQITRYVEPDLAETAVEHQELIMSLRTQFVHLSKRERVVMDAIIVRQLTVEETATLLGISRANIHNVMSRARVKLKTAMLRILLDARIRRRRALGLPVTKQLQIGHVFY